jgi:hypothetical protein
MIMASGGKLVGTLILVVGVLLGIWLADKVGYHATSPVTVPVEVQNTGELAAAVQSAPPPAPAVMPTQVPAAAPSGGQSTTVGLTPAMAEAWCVSGCAGRFEQLKEGNGVVNPYGVHLRTGNPVQINLPAGVSGQVWTCFPPAIDASGPATLPQVCEASFRQS